LIFTVLSRDYLEATSHQEQVPGAASNDELRAFAEASGFTIVGFAGYGVLLGHPLGGASLLSPTDTTHRWRRMLSWMRRDDALADLAAFIDLEIVSRLPLSVAPCVMVALEKGTSGGPHVHAPATHHAAFAAVAARNAELDLLLEPVKARLFGFALLDHLAAHRPDCPAVQLLTPRRAMQYALWARANRIDREVVRAARDWSDGCRAKVRHDVDVTLSADYFLVRGILEDYLDLYRGDAE
jgi:hypothetical protein